MSLLPHALNVARAFPHSRPSRLKNVGMIETTIWKPGFNIVTLGSNTRRAQQYQVLNKHQGVSNRDNDTLILISENTESATLATQQWQTDRKQYSVLVWKQLYV